MKRPFTTAELEERLLRLARSWSKSKEEFIAEFEMLEGVTPTMLKSAWKTAGR